MHLLMRIIKLDGPSIVSGVICTATVCLDLRYLKLQIFLFWLQKSKKLSVSAIFGYRSMLSAVFCTVLPEISTSPVLHDLLRFFNVEAPCRVIRSPAWDLLKVLDYLRSSVFEPLSNSSLRGFGYGQTSSRSSSSLTFCFVLLLCCGCFICARIFGQN